MGENNGHLSQYFRRWKEYAMKTVEDDIRLVGKLVLGSIAFAVVMFTVAMVIRPSQPSTCTCDNSAKVETNARRY